MYDWDAEINKEHKIAKKKWNRKVITTAKQWEYNADGAREVSNYSYDKSNLLIPLAFQSGVFRQLEQLLHFFNFPMIIRSKFIGLCNFSGCFIMTCIMS